MKKMLFVIFIVGFIIIIGSLNKDNYNKCIKREKIKCEQNHVNGCEIEAKEICEIEMM